MLNADVLCLSVSPLFVTLIGKILGSVENCTSSEKKKKWWEHVVITQIT